VNLQQAVRELTEQAEEKSVDLMALAADDNGIFNVGKIKSLPQKYYRDVEHNGQRYRVCFTRMEMVHTYLFMLSIAKPSAPANSEGAHLPDPAECVEIAEAFFPEGYTALDARDQIITMTCRKFINTKPIPKEAQ
jgi:hypothetical protein